MGWIFWSSLGQVIITEIAKQTAAIVMQQAIFKKLSIASAISSAAKLPFPLNIGAMAIAAAAVISLFGKHGLATGGFVKDNMTLVGERGAELVRLPKGSRVYNNPESMNMLHNMNSEGKRIINNIINFSNNNFLGTPEDIADTVSDKIFRNLQFEANI